jgi:hypothetical protein
MLLNFTVDAGHQLRLIQNIKTIKNGFVLGKVVGKNLIVKHLLPANFTEDTIDESYLNLYKQRRRWLLGVFFNSSEPFFNHWFIEDIILKIESHNHLGIYVYTAKGQLKLMNDSIPSG